MATKGALLWWLQGKWSRKEQSSGCKLFALSTPTGEATLQKVDGCGHWEQCSWSTSLAVQMAKAADQDHSKGKDRSGVYPF